MSVVCLCFYRATSASPLLCLITDALWNTCGSPRLGGSGWEDSRVCTHAVHGGAAISPACFYRTFPPPSGETSVALDWGSRLGHAKVPLPRQRCRLCDTPPLTLSLPLLSRTGGGRSSRRTCRPSCRSPAFHRAMSCGSSSRTKE